MPHPAGMNQQACIRAVRQQCARATGMVEATDPAKTGLTKPVKLITASDVAPLRR